MNSQQNDNTQSKPLTSTQTTARGAFGRQGTNRKRTIREYQNTIAGLARQLLAERDRNEVLETEVSKVKGIVNAN